MTETLKQITICDRNTLTRWNEAKAAYIGEKKDKLTGMREEDVLNFVLDRFFGVAE